MADQPLGGPARGKRRVCRQCGVPGHYRKQCPENLPEAERSPTLGPRVVVVPEMQFRVVEDFEEPGGGPALLQDDVWVAAHLHSHPATEPPIWIMRKGDEKKVGFALHPTLHPFQPVPASAGTIEIVRIGIGPLAGWEEAA